MNKDKFPTAMLQPVSLVSPESPELPDSPESPDLLVSPDSLDSPDLPEPPDKLKCRASFFLQEFNFERRRRRGGGGSEQDKGKQYSVGEIKWVKKRKGCFRRV